MTSSPMGNERGEHADPQSESGQRQGPEPGDRLIRARAHEIWIEEGKPEGRALAHWLRACWELEKAPDPKAELERLERELDPGHRSV